MLPPTAPRVRATAGLGTAGQKTWNLRRPVTLVGAGRHSHIVVAGAGVSKAHCAIVNTGTEVLLKDLHSDGGTLRNGERVDLAPLSDGDVVQVGETRIQLAIGRGANASAQTQLGVKVTDPARPAKRVCLQLGDGNRQWIVQEAACVIGRRASAPVCLDDPAVSLAHALLFRVGDQLAMHDLGSRTGITINGDRRSMFVFTDIDRVGIGPFELRVGADGTGATNGDGIQDERPIHLDRREAELAARARQLDEREAALEARAAELQASEIRLQEWEERLSARQREIEWRNRASTAEIPGAPSHIVFTGAVGSAEAALPDGLPTDNTRETLERVARTLAQMKRCGDDAGGIPAPPEC